MSTSRHLLLSRPVSTNTRGQRDAQFWKGLYFKQDQDEKKQKGDVFCVPDGLSIASCTKYVLCSRQSARDLWSARDVFCVPDGLSNVFCTISVLCSRWLHEISGLHEMCSAFQMVRAMKRSSFALSGALLSHYCFVKIYERFILMDACAKIVKYDVWLTLCTLFTRQSRPSKISSYQALTESPNGL